MSDASDDPPFDPPAAVHRGPANTSPYPVSRLAPAMELIDYAREIAQADALVNQRVTAKLQVIAEQIRALQAQAREVLAEARADQELHRAHCAFRRIPGRLYHLYRRRDGGLEFSLLSPDDWGQRPPHTFVGSYRLEADMSWTAADRLEAVDDSRELVGRLLGSALGG